MILEPLSVVSITEKGYFSLVKFYFLMSIFFDNLIGWMLVTQCWNRNRVYSSIILMPVTLRWCQLHIVNQPITLLFIINGTYGADASVPAVVVQ